MIETLVRKKKSKNDKQAEAVTKKRANNVAGAENVAEQRRIEEEQISTNDGRAAENPNGAAQAQVHQSEAAASSEGGNNLMSPNNDDAFEVHPDDDDYAMVEDANEPESNDIANLTLVDYDSDMIQASNVLNQPLLAPNASTGAVPKTSKTVMQKQPMRIIVDESINPDMIREYVEIDGRSVERVRRDTAEYFARANVQSRQCDRQTSRVVSTEVPRKEAMQVGWLRRIHGEINAPEFVHENKFTIQTRIKLVERYYGAFMTAHESKYQAANAPSEIRSLDQECSQVENIYLEIMSVLQSRLDNVSVSSNETRPEYHQKQNIKVERIRFPKFDGDIEKWKDFKSMFENHFHNNLSYSDFDRILFLNNYLEDNSEPKRAISGVQLIGSNYQSTWESLCDEYDDDRRFMDKRFRDWYRIEPIGDPPSRVRMRKLVTTTRNLIKEMPAYGVDTKHWGLWMVPYIVDKLDERTRERWAMDRPKKVLPEIEVLLKYIEDRSEGLEDRVMQNQCAPRRSENNQNFRNSDNNNKNRQSNFNASTNKKPGEISNREKNRKCPDPICKPPNNEHRLFNCKRFRSLDLAQRQSKVKYLDVCTLCLRKGCNANACTLRKCLECDETHNSLLCPKKVIPPMPMSVVTKPVVNVIATAVPTRDRSSGSRSATSAAVTSTDGDGEQSMLATSLITINDKQGNPITFRALCDPGSQINLMTTDAYQKLRFGQVRRQFNFIGVGGIESTAAGQVSVLYKSRFATGNRFGMAAIVVRKITSPLPLSNLNKSKWKHLDGITLADPTFHIQGEIDILLGAGAFSEIIKPGIKRGMVGEPIAQCTRIGWIVYGRTEMTYRQRDHQRVLHIAAASGANMNDTRVEELLERFWQMEQVATKKLRTAEEQFCEDHFVENTTRDSNGRYVVKIPINQKLGESRPIALRRFLQMEQRFIKSPELRHKYIHFMNEYLELGHMKEAPPLQDGVPHYYIPHHAAGTKKFRVVFDGSSRTKSGVALNDTQMTGEKIQPELVAILTRFRLNRIAITADIKKMYRQVRIDPSQLDLQRILWREDTNQPIKEFQLTTQTYGLRSAAHSCIRALNQCAIDHENEHPIASMVTKRDFYVDDLISGTDTELEAVELRREMDLIMSKAGFELDKWSTNSWILLSEWNGSSIDEPVTFEFDEETESSVLGMSGKRRVQIQNHRSTIGRKSDETQNRLANGKIV